MILTKEQQDKAVKWWADHVQPRKMEITVADEYGEFVQKQIPATLFSNDVTHEQIEHFCKALHDMISDVDVMVHELFVDMMPSYFLRKAAIAANVPLLNFPSYTCMKFDPDGAIYVSVGVNRPWEMI